MKRWLCGGVLLPALLAVGRLSGGALGPHYGGELVVGVTRLAPGATTPWVPSAGGDALATRLVHEGLVRLGPEGFPVPALAERWTAAASGSEWTLEIAQSARFHDDRLVTAEDAVRSVRRFLRSPSPAAARLAATLEGGPAFRSGSRAELPGLAAPDARRVVLRFEAPLSAPLAPLAAPAAAVTGAAGVGCGPFVPLLQVPGRSLALVAFGSHVRGRPFLDRVKLVAVAADRPAARADLREGRLDLLTDEPGDSRLAATLLLLLDPKHPPFDRPSNRDAVAAALERDALAALVPGADARPQLLAPHLLRGQAELPAARESVKGAVLLAVATDVPPLLSQRIVAQLEALGLRTSVTPSDPESTPAARAAVRLIRWAPEVPEPGLALRELMSLAPASRLVRESVEAADLELDLDRRRTLLEEAEAVLRADRVLLPLALVPAAFAARPGVHGARLDAAGRLLLEDAWAGP